MQAVKALTGSVRLTAPVASSIQAKPTTRLATVDAIEPRRVNALAIPNTPPSFEVNGKKVVFADIQNADNSVIIDVKARKSTVSATVDFEIAEKGRPVIELVPNATKVTVDGKVIDPKSFSDVRDPANESNFRIIDMDLDAGKHRVEIEYELGNGVRYSGDSVEVFTRKSDLDDRSMDEQYFPTNLEYDQYPGKLSFEIRGTDVQHRIMTNGDVTGENNKFTVSYPAHFNTASRFLNIINPANFEITEDTYAGKNGSIPITVYTPKNLSRGDKPFGHGVGIKHEPGKHPRNDEHLSAEATASCGMEIVKAGLAKHEKDIAPFPHPRMLVRVSGSGGMEYSGAVESDLGSLHHELHHQWFARSAQPANGNAGWIDEALASWHDRGYRTSSSQPSFGRRLSGFPAWHRITPQAAYSHGADIMGYLDHVFQPKGGFRPVLTKWFEGHSKKVFTTEEFLSFVKDQGRDLKFDFDAFFKAQVYAAGLTRVRRRA